MLIKVRDWRGLTKQQQLLLIYGIVAFQKEKRELAANLDHVKINDEV